MADFKTILQDLGYTLLENANEFRARPIYRESGNNTSLRINKETGHWIDFSLCINGPFEELVALTLNLKDISEVKQFLKTKYDFNFQAVKVRPKVSTIKTYPDDVLAKLLPKHDYWLNRHISINTLKLFRGGVATAGKMAKRYVFPIFNSNGRIIGFTGRTLVEAVPKWKHAGPKTEWLYPLFLNYDIIRKKQEVILVESVGDGLALWEAGIKNFIVVFGVEPSRAVINVLLKLNLNKIIIAFNNDIDEDNGEVGRKAAEKTLKELKRHFDSETLEIRLPILKDINKMWIEDPSSVTRVYGAL
jgi:5S rRNA maturation endonuclease (ribonuclease M5)